MIKIIIIIKGPEIVYYGQGTWKPAPIPEGKNLKIF